jgi:hypothetical protein
MIGRVRLSFVAAVRTSLCVCLAMVSVESVKQAERLVWACWANPVEFALTEFRLMLLQGLRVREGSIARSADVLLRTCGRGGQEWRIAIINLWLE